MTYFLAVANQKGGVAKTTTVISLGAALVEQGHDVLVVDLDAQANLTMALGIDPARVRQSIANVLMSLSTFTSVSIPTSVNGLDLVPSNSEMALAERFLPVRKGYEIILRSAINGSIPYDFVLFDCPPQLGAVTANALNASQFLIVPTQAEYFSMAALRNMTATIRHIRQASNPGLEYRILLTLYDRRNRIHRNLGERLRQNFASQMFETVIDIDTKLRESTTAGLPINHYQPNSRSVQQYRELAKEVIQYVQEPEPTAT